MTPESRWLSPAQVLFVLTEPSWHSAQLSAGGAEYIKALSCKL